MNNKQLLFIGYLILNLGFAIGFGQFSAPIFSDFVGCGLALGLVVIGEILGGIGAKRVYGTKTKSATTEY